MTRLHPGERVLYQGTIWTVVMVNDCRAVIQPERSRQVSLERPNGERVAFEATPRGISISPYSELERTTHEED